MSRSLARRRTWRGPGKLTLPGRCRRGFDPVGIFPSTTNAPSFRRGVVVCRAMAFPAPDGGSGNTYLYYKWRCRLHATSSAILARPPGRGPLWPADKLTALRTGQRLITEVPASRPGRRAFIDITPVTTPADAQARQQGWKRTDHARAFRLQHWDYDADRIDGYDYDRGAVMIRAAAAADEAELLTTLQAWQLRPDQFRYPWQTDDPK